MQQLPRSALGDEADCRQWWLALLSRHKLCGEGAGMESPETLSLRWRHRGYYRDSLALRICQSYVHHVVFTPYLSLAVFFRFCVF
jgi:hypothetical protein